MRKKLVFEDEDEDEDEDEALDEVDDEDEVAHENEDQHEKGVVDVIDDKIVHKRLTGSLT